MVNLSSVFPLLGLECVSSEDGVCHLRRHAASGDVVNYVGLLFSPAPADTVDVVHLFLTEVPEPGLVPRIMQHWKTLDARRLEESGITPILVHRNATSLGKETAPLQFLRPDRVRMRYAARMQSGDVVCYN